MLASPTTMFEFDGKLVDFGPYFRFYDYAWHLNTKRPSFKETNGHGLCRTSRFLLVTLAAGSQAQAAIAAAIEWHHRTKIPVDILTMHPMRSWNYLLRDEDDFRILSGFGSAGEREMERDLLHLSKKKIYRILTSFAGLGKIYERMYPHAIVTNVSAETKEIDGVKRYSTGPSADFGYGMIVNPRLEANRGIPTLAVVCDSLDWMYGNSIPEDRFYNFVKGEAEFHDTPSGSKVDPISSKIGENVYQIIKNISQERGGPIVLQVGIGKIATKIFQLIAADGGKYVRWLKTEVTGNGVELLPEDMPIDCTIVLGNQDVRKVMANKPHRRVRPVEETNGYRDAAEVKLVCANWVMQANLWGEGASEIGRNHGGSGGAPDFAGNLGAEPNFGLPSRRWNKKTGEYESNIVLDFAPGSTRVAIQADQVTYSTEFGTADLRPYFCPERLTMVAPTQEEVVVAMISIAHPDFREELIRQAIEARPDFEDEITALAIDRGLIERPLAA